MTTSDDHGPYRGSDLVAARLDTIDQTLTRLDDNLVRWGHLATGPRPIRILAPWIGLPPAVLSVAYALALLIGSCNDGCLASDRAEHQTKTAAAAAEAHERERFCAAVGLRFAGVASIEPVHYDSKRWPQQPAVYDTVVCGNGHGDGMYVGTDGHLHALRATP